MSADPTPSPAVDQVREALAERLRDLSYRGRQMTGPEASTYADFLLPALSALLAEARADELRDTAAALRGLGWEGVPRVLDDREMAIRASIRQTDERNDR